MIKLIQFMLKIILRIIYVSIALAIISCVVAIVAGIAIHKNQSKTITLKEFKHAKK